MLKNKLEQYKKNVVETAVQSNQKKRASKTNSNLKKNCYWLVNCCGKAQLKEYSQEVEIVKDWNRDSLGIPMSSGVGM